MFKKLRTVIYHVADLQKAKQWYIDVTGVQPYFDEHFYVGFDINGCELGLDPDLTNIDEGNMAIAYWTVDDIEAAVKQLIQQGASVVLDIAGVGEGIKTAVVQDPFGNAVGLIEEQQQD
jgi:predicted enzyme related to lactoylglutathione lyase